MSPFSDRVVIVALVATLGVVFALVFWFVRLQPARELPMQWRDGQKAQLSSWRPASDAAAQPT
jgi:hypothetical protein